VDLLELVCLSARMLPLETAPHKTLYGNQMEVLGVTIDCNRGVALIGVAKLEKIKSDYGRCGRG
jgi:hypothetical protein